MNKAENKGVPSFPYKVMLEEDPGDKFKIVFECVAEDADHAAAQAEEAYPGCRVVSETQMSDIPAKHYAVIGRIPFEEESCFLYQAVSVEDAVKMFARDIYKAFGLTEKTRLENAEEHAAAEGVFLTATLCSDAPIIFCED